MVRSAPEDTYARLDLPHLRRPVPGHAAAAGGMPDLSRRAAVRRVGGSALDVAGRAAPRPCQRAARGGARPARRRRHSRRRDRAAGAAGPHPGGNVLWDCVPVLDDDTVERIGSLGGISAVAVSHPHFYAANVDIADAFDARVLLPHADREWVQRPSPRLEFFDDQVAARAGRDGRPDRRPLRRRRRAALAGRIARAAAPCSPATRSPSSRTGPG